MAVSKKEKKLLQDMWESSDEGPEGSLPDGKYQFKITEATFGMSGSDKPRVASVLEVVGGNEDLMGEEVTIYDNLETPENMSWFKRKLKRLHVDMPDDFDDIVDGTTCGEMTGKIFEGQVKTKDGFLNIYVNRLTGDDEEGEETETVEDEESTEEKLEKEDIVTFTFKGDEKKGEVLEVLEDDDKVRIKEEGTGKVFKVSADKVEIVYEDGDGGTGEEEEEESGGEERSFPKPSAIKKLNKADLSKALETLGLDYDEVVKPKEITLTIAEVIAGETPKKAQLTAACKAFGRKVKADDDVKKLKKYLTAEIDAATME